MQRMISLRTMMVLAGLITVGACGQVPASSAYLNRGGPESLLDVSSEVVTLATANKTDLLDLAAWLDKDKPTRAVLNCVESDKECSNAKKILDLNGVPFAMGSGSDASVTLTYERILVRDCNQRYVDNTPNHYNVNHASFGCALSANMVQQVTNKQEFISPNLSDDPSAVRAINDQRRAYKPRPVIDPYTVSESLSQKSSQ